jgi:amino acid adenylation domain-containing protein
MSDDDGSAASNLVDVFTATAARFPDRVAVRCGERALTYRELAEASSQWAGRLMDEGCSGRAVAILLDRSVDIVVVAIAVLKAGGWYVPLDPEVPSGRLESLLQDAAPALVLTSHRLAANVPGAARMLAVEDLAAEPGYTTSATGTGVRELEGSARAYMIFTSGSTGRPKGVAVSHANVTQLFSATRSLFGFEPDDVWTLFHSFAFDFSVWEMWGALLSGACVVVVPVEITRNPVTFWDLLRDERVTVLSQTPTAFNLLTAEDARRGERLPLRWVVFGGEELRFADCRRWLEKYGDESPALMNMYGITEITVHATYHRVTQANLDRTGSVIGRPLPGQDIQLLDADLAPVPAGEVGEIVVTGPGVASGYLNRLELERERFISVPGRDGRPVRGYRSGDLAVLTGEGELEYRGRADDQVKIRGHRVELGEIRAVLERVPGITQAAVTARRPEPAGNPVLKQRDAPGEIRHIRELLRGTDQSGQTGRRGVDSAVRIVAYVVRAEGFDADQMFAWLHEQLPPYMIPAFVIPVEAIPVNQNGKLDRDQLPAPSAADYLRPSNAQAGPDSAVGDSTALSATLCELFQEVLGIEGVTADDSFFSVGGDSIFALDLCAAAEARGLTVELAELYELQTPHALAAAITTSPAESSLATGPGPDAAAPRPAGDTAALTATLCELFQELLGVEGVTADDSFFSVGGDSFLALDLCAAAKGRGLAVEPDDLYMLQTPRALAAAVTAGPTGSGFMTQPFSLLQDADRALLPKTGIVDAYPLATLQAGVLFHSAYGAEHNMYCDIFMFRLKAEFNREALQSAIDRAIDRHEILRTSFHFADYSQPLQMVHPTGSAPLTVVDLTGVSPAEQEAALDAHLEWEKTTPYDWSRPALMRLSVHLLDPERFVLWMGFHDALLDGWSESALLTEILTDYWELCADPDRPAAPRPVIRYADFVALELAALRDEDVRKFWAKELDGVEPMLMPRLASGEQDVHRGRIGFLSVEVGPDLSGRLDEAARARNVTLKHVLLAVHARVQATLNSRDEVLLGIESNGRVEERDSTAVLGTHLNVVPYRLPTRGASWAGLIDAAWAKESELLPYRRYPLAELQHLAGVPELSDILFNYTHFRSYEALSSTGIRVLDAKGYNLTSLTLRVEFNKDPFTGLLNLDLEANLEWVTEDQLRMVGELYRNALTGLAADVEAVPRQRDLLGPQLSDDLIAGFRGPQVPAGAESWFEFFNRAVERYAEHTAAQCGGDSIGYRALSERVDSMAGWLSRLGVGPGTVVGLSAERGIGYLVALLAVLRIGAVYLPLPAGPALRVGRMLRSSSAALVLCDGARRALIGDGISEAAGETTGQDTGVEVVDLSAALAEAQSAVPYSSPAPGGRDLAYALFTSGSTGEPKGALIRHDGMLNHNQAKIEALGLGPGDRVSQDAAATFDISVWQWLAPLLVGATTVIYPDEIGQDPLRLLRAVAEDGVTVLEVSPSVLNVMRAELGRCGLDAFPPFALRSVASQAEALLPQHANGFRRLLPEVRLLNMWGITETSDDCTHYEVVGEADEKLASLPIGRPIRNTAVYVLGADRDPVPAGSPGELYVGGVAVGAGYLGDETRTAAKFVPDPYSPDPAAVMYRTGDRGRQLADGSLEFLGRIDDQLKIRGQRVELGEVTGALSAVPGVQESAVVARGSGAETRLLGFFVAPSPDASADLVRADLVRVLPRYAVPDHLTRVDALPRTPHGKVDTKALASWEVTAPAPARPTEPATPTEAAVLETWADVFRFDPGPMGPSSNFFELGGHSLHATQAMARLRERFGVDLSVRALFEQPTARALAQRIDGLRAAEPAADGARAAVHIAPRPAGMREFPLAHSQSSLWFLQELDPEDRSYENGNLILLSGPLDVEALRFAVDEVVQRHEILSVRFGSRAGVPFQAPTADGWVRLEVEDADPGLAGDGAAMLALARERYLGRRFDLVNGPIAAARLYRFGPTGHVLEWSSHHIISDGWSNGIVLRDVQESYVARREGRPSRLPRLPVQYPDYARWQGEFLRNSPRAEAQLAYWRDRLAGYAGDLDLATDIERADDRSRVAGYVDRRWGPESSERLRAFAREHGVTPFMLFHTVAAVLTAKLGQQPDVVLGAAVAGRGVPGTEDLVGFFANTLPFRHRVDLDDSAAALLAAVSESVLSGFDHQLVPFQEIVRVCDVPRFPGVPPLVQVFITVDAYPFDASGSPGLTVTREQLRPDHSLFDLVYEFVDEAELGLTLRYDTSLFHAATALRLADAVERLLDFVVRQPTEPLRSAPLLGEDDLAALGELWYGLAGTPADFGRPPAREIIGSPHWDAFFDQVEQQGLMSALLLAL